MGRRAENGNFGRFGWGPKPSCDPTTQHHSRSSGTGEHDMWRDWRQFEKKSPWHTEICGCFSTHALNFLNSKALVLDH